MHLVCYLAHDDTNIPAIQQRFSLAHPPVGLVTASSAPEVISRTQSLPIRAILLDISWPRATWKQLRSDLARVQRPLPLIAISAEKTTCDWWQFADDMLSLDDNLDLFLFRLNHAIADTEKSVLELSEDHAQISLPVFQMMNGSSPILADAPGLLEMPQFRQFAEIFAGMEEPELLEAFISWVQTACQTSRAVLLLRDSISGNFTCRAQRGLPSALVPHCTFLQTAPLCRWLSVNGQILLRDTDPANIGADILNGLDLLQAVAAIPVMHDGQLIGILGLGPRLIGKRYTAFELEGVFAIASQVAVAIYHRRNHWSVKQQQELTEEMLGVMPTGTIVLGHDHRISFVNAAAANIIDKPRTSIIGADLRILPSPLGDLAYESLIRKVNISRREMTLAFNNRPIAVTACMLSTNPPSAMLLLEDRSAEKVLEEERERRVDLEVITNLVHYIAHELRNPLVTLSTFSSLVPTRAGDEDFQEYCETVLQPEIGRVNLIIEQLLVLTNHAEYQFTDIDLLAMLERLTDNEELKHCLVTAMPVSLPLVHGDANRLETALTCLIRTVLRFNDTSTPATMRIELEESGLLLNFEIPTNISVTSSHLLNPWNQLFGDQDAEVDFGIATASYIFEQHQGSLEVKAANAILTVTGHLPLRANNSFGRDSWHDAAESTHRR